MAPVHPGGRVNVGQAKALRDTRSRRVSGQRRRAVLLARQLAERAIRLASVTRAAVIRHDERVQRGHVGRRQEPLPLGRVQADRELLVEPGNTQHAGFL